MVKSVNDDGGSGRAEQVKREALDQWFVTAVLPCEPLLNRYLVRNWRRLDEIADLRQEIYCRAYEAATRQSVKAVKPFLLMIARNLLIDTTRRKRIVEIDTFAQLVGSSCEPSFDPGGQLIARDELRRLQQALDALPPRCRDAVYKRKVLDWSQREIAESMQVSVHTVEKHLVKGVRLLAELMHRGEETKSATRIGGTSKRAGLLNMSDKI